MSSPVEEFEDRTLMQHLLGNLSEADAERLDALSVSDDAMDARLCDAENDLVDAYVRGELQGDTLERFRSHYLTTPRRRRKVEFAQSLLKLEHGRDKVIPFARPAPPVAAPRVPASRGWRLALAAAVLLSVAAGIALDDARVRRSLSNEQASLAELSSRVSAGRQDLEAERSRSNALTAETRRLAGLIDELRAAGIAESAKPLVVRIASFLLLPPSRGMEAPPVLAVPSDVQQLEIRLVLEENEFRHYRVRLKSQGSSAVSWQSPVLEAEHHAGGAELKLTLPAALFKAGVYKLELSSLPQGHEEPLASYAFIADPT
jgi:hypothetical protein